MGSPIMVPQIRGLPRMVGVFLDTRVDIFRYYAVRHVADGTWFVIIWVLNACKLIDQVKFLLKVPINKIEERFPIWHKLGRG